MPECGQPAFGHRAPFLRPRGRPQESLLRQIESSSSPERGPIDPRDASQHSCRSSADIASTSPESAVLGANFGRNRAELGRIRANFGRLVESGPDLAHIDRTRGELDPTWPPITHSAGAHLGELQSQIRGRRSECNGCGASSFSAQTRRGVAQWLWRGEASCLSGQGRGEASRNGCGEARRHAMAVAPCPSRLPSRFCSKTTWPSGYGDGLEIH